MPTISILPALLLLASVAPLGVMLVAQYGFGLLPCPLCIYQRIPYAVSAALALIALLPAVPRKARIGLFGLSALALLVDGGIAAFHVGVEQHWWAGLEACMGGGPQPQSVDQLRALLAAPSKTPRCDEIPWSLFGISIAGFNVMYALGLAGFAAWATLRLKDRA